MRKRVRGCPVRRCAEISVAMGCAARAIRVVCDAVCALAPATDNKQALVKASNIAAALIHIIISHYEPIVGCNVSDCQVNVNRGLDFTEVCRRI